jgi:pyruvate dehydrogenase (quinone)
MGAKGIRIEEPGDVREGLAVALAHQDGPVVVDVVVDPYALSLRSHLPFRTVNLTKIPCSGPIVAFGFCQS